MNKKAVLGQVLIFSVILAFGFFLFFSIRYQDEKGGLKSEQRVIGELQMGLLQQMAKAEKAILYIQESAKLSIVEAKSEMKLHGGYFEPEFLYLNYSVWDFDELLLPDIESSFTKYLNKNLDFYLFQYEDTYIPTDNYNYYFGQDYIMGVASTNLLPVSQSRSVGIPEDIDNQVLNCKDSDCLHDLAKSYSNLYVDLPYVWGGESPYTYETSIKDQRENPRTIFDGVSLTKLQPAGNKRSGNPTVPGFDCSGLFWWVYKHAGLVNSRLSANDYYKVAQNKWQEVCDGDCTKNTIKAQAEPGDAMFISPCSRGVCHIGIYMGSNTIFESASTANGVIEHQIPASYHNGRIVAVYRPVFALTQADAPTEEVFDPPVTGGDVLYSVKPSFNIKADHGMEFYKELKNQAFEVSRKLQQCNAIECVEYELSQKNWELGCGIDSGFFGIAQQLEDCAQSIDDNCACDIEFGKKDMDIKIKMDLLSYDDIELLLSANLSYKDTPNSAAEKIEDNTLIIRYDEETTAEIDLQSLIALESPDPNDYNLAPKIYKQGNTVYFMANADAASECTMPKKTYPICVDEFRFALR